MVPEKKKNTFEELTRENKKLREQAEKFTREATIEAALERVRSRTMAMQNSEELSAVVKVLYDQIGSLNILDLGCNLNIFYEEETTIEEWVAGFDFQELPQAYRIQGIKHPIIKKCWDSWKAQQPFIHIHLKGQEYKNYIKYLLEETELQQLPEEFKNIISKHKEVYFTYVSMKYGQIQAVHSSRRLSDEDSSIILRFANVFEQTYTRFLDLQKAEEQARKAQIEAALERIRARSMAMQSSDELSEVVRVMYDEVEKLEVSNWGCALMIFDDDPDNIRIWFSEPINKLHARSYDINNLNHKIVREWQKFWKSDEQNLSIHLRDKEKYDLDTYLFTNTGLKNYPDEVKQAILNEKEVYFEFVKMKQGMVEFIDIEPFPEDSIPVLQRITRTFEQAYTRFLDVQRAERLALETARQSSLDRIRAEIASMRSAEDLNQITPIIWDELKSLEIPFIRCGVFIIDEENGISHTYLSTSQGDPIAALHLPLQGISLIENAHSCWKKEEIYTEHWNEQDFRNWTQKLIDGGFITSKKKYSAGSTPKELHLHFLPFKHGMLYIGNTEPLSQGELDLGQSMANAFSVAYDRYEDFNKLEQAKQKIEEAFQELEAAKDQLVQQEKLASLGQLTAGIAHEIKNPLNFVNNFSDLSIELVEEAREEIERQKADVSSENSPLEGSVEVKRRRGVSDEATNHNLILDILDDVEMNLKKIHEHGTRADGIVKSMLQHSRGGDGKMEPKPLNPLIKEYVNLAFHGMRAGKQPINVDIELDLDKDICEVDMITEDFSRVILNLCNNAFDAMREKLSENAEAPDGSGLQNTSSKSEKALSPNPSPEGEGRRGEGEYSPKLIVRTHQKDKTVTIEIEDNGPGIPEEIKDKILQPFFTTKKGTAGTGLGLSITNDIIKAHGGSLDIKSSKQRGSTITIILNPS